MDQVARKIDATGGWTYLGGDDESKKPVEVVVRAFDGALLFAVGSGPSRPDEDPIPVPKGEGRRLRGRHFFVQPESPHGRCLITVRGL